MRLFAILTVNANIFAKKRRKPKIRKIHKMTFLMSYIALKLDINSLLYPHLNFQHSKKKNFFEKGQVLKILDCDF